MRKEILKVIRELWLCVIVCSIEDQSHESIIKLYRKINLLRIGNKSIFHQKVNYNCKINEFQINAEAKTNQKRNRVRKSNLGFEKFYVRFVTSKSIVFYDQFPYHDQSKFGWIVENHAMGIENFAGILALNGNGKK